jgi:catechol 2,3-dioxygenase-like lactoylglutathione lyase family enzyme
VNHESRVKHTGMSNLYARTVFFVSDAAGARRFYTDQLGFALDWDSNDGVFQVSLLGFELILNQVGDATRQRTGHGRLFIGLEEEQAGPFRTHLAAKGIRPRRVEWGRPTLAVSDPDGNELFFWLPHDDFTGIVCAPDSVSAPIINTVEPQLCVRDITASLEFYSAMLGFSVAFVHGDPPFYAQVARGGARLNLRHVDRPIVSAGDAEQLLAATITLDDADALFAEYQRAGVTFAQPPRNESWGARTFIVRDPDGSLLLFAGHGRVRDSHEDLASSTS